MLVLCVDVEGEVRSVLFDGAAGQNADLAEIDGIIDFRPGEFFVAVFGFGSVVHDFDMVG